MRNKIPLLSVLLCLIFSLPVSAEKIIIKVGAGIRPPFLLPNGKGMGVDILSAFNLVQNQFQFDLVPVPIARRVKSLKEGWVDIVMWDNIKWGWGDDFELNSSIPLLYSEDSFVTHFSQNKQQSYFENFKNKRICGVNGYHYKFLNYETDYRKLLEQYDITLIRTEEESKWRLMNAVI